MSQDPTSDAPPRLVLASGSPRRSAMLSSLGLEVDARPQDLDETPLSDEGPAELCERLARAKATAATLEGALSFGFDTVVSHRGEVLGKPRTTDEAIEMVERLGDDTHVVYTGIAAATPERVESRVETTTVRFRRLVPGEAVAYVATGEPMDKAGAYGIQGLGAALVEGVDGDYFNVMGFPIGRFQDLLIEFGWRYRFGHLTPAHPTDNADPEEHPVGGDGPND